MRTLGFMIGVCLIQQAAMAQSDLIAGDWVVQFLDDSFFIHDFSIQNQGSTTFTESFQETIDGQALNFSVQTAGVSQFNATRQFVFAGAGAGVADESRNYRAVTTVAATGFGSQDSNLIAGVWIESQIVNMGISPVLVNEASPVPFVMKREGSIPVFTTDGLYGTWSLTMNDESLVIDWDGMLELTREGVFIGRLLSHISGGDIPLGGLFEVDGDTITFHYAASVELSTFGMVTVIVDGLGTINEDHTAIDGEFTVTVARDASDVTPQQVQMGVFNGAFSMEKQAQSNVSNWQLFN